MTWYLMESILTMFVEVFGMLCMIVSFFFLGYFLGSIVGDWWYKDENKND